MKRLRFLVVKALEMIENGECEDLKDEDIEMLSMLIHRPETVGREDAAKLMGVSLNRFHEFKNMGIVSEPKKIKGHKEKGYYISDLQKSLKIVHERGL